MQTIYKNTFNLIDLSELRRRRDLAHRDSLARQPKEERWVTEETSNFRPVVLTATPEERRRARRERCAWRLDVCASLAVIVMTVVFALRMLI